MEPTGALPWITIFHPAAPLQEEAYLPLSGTISPNFDKKSMSLRTACFEAYKTILESVEQHVLVFCHGPNYELILKSRPSSDFHTSNYEAPKSVPPSYLRSQIDYSCSKLKPYRGRKHLENLADNMGAEHFPSTYFALYLPPLF
jgi:hypothetical protein